MMLIGGARRGKSSLAVEWGRRQGGPVTYVATAPNGESDAAGGGEVIDRDMVDRIDRHRRERPDSWTTIEEPYELGRAIEAAGTTAVIVDCLTLWTSNLMWLGRSDDEIVTEADAVAKIAATRTLVAITNEVGLGVHPETHLGRRYRDVLGWVNQTWAAAAATTLFLVAGRAMELHDPWTLLPDGRPR